MINEFEAACAASTTDELEAAVIALQSGQSYRYGYTIYRVFAPGIVSVQQDIPTDRFATSDQDDDTAPEGVRANVRRARLIARELGFGSCV